MAPNATLIQAANEGADANDGSYVLIYRTCGGNIVFGGDAHDNTWDYILTYHKEAVENCVVLVAPHHGRDSDRCYDFLDVLKPRITLLGCADSRHMGYDAWNKRDLSHITSNQAGNILLDVANEGVDIYVENVNFARQIHTHEIARTLNGATYICTVEKPRLPAPRGSV